MLGVCLRQLCPQDSFDYAFREKKLSENRPPEGAKPARGGSKMVCGRPPDGSFAPVGPNLAAKAARKPSVGGSGGALGALLEGSWEGLGRSWAVWEASWRTSWCCLRTSWCVLEASWPLGSQKSMGGTDAACFRGRGGGVAAATPGLPGRI